MYIPGIKLVANEIIFLGFINTQRTDLALLVFNLAKVLLRNVVHNIRCSRLRNCLQNALESIQIDSIDARLFEYAFLSSYLSRRVHIEIRSSSSVYYQIARMEIFELPRIWITELQIRACILTERQLELLRSCNPVMTLNLSPQCMQEILGCLDWRCRRYDARLICMFHSFPIYNYDDPLLITKRLGRKSSWWLTFYL